MYIEVPQEWILSPIDNEGYSIKIDEYNTAGAEFDIYSTIDESTFFKRHLDASISLAKKGTLVSNNISFHGRNALEIEYVSATNNNIHNYSIYFIENQTYIELFLYSKDKYNETAPKVKEFFNSAEFK